ncbi:NCS2 family permease [Micrococcales bacterium 31B]|nr:NCS2 family permease [Micrococcales bacterium 31B]
MATPAAPTHLSALDRYFYITERGSTIGREIRGGLVTFFTMAYIIVLNPLLIGTVPDSTGRYIGGGTEPNIALVAAGTALVAAVMSAAMGGFAKYPLAIATGLGLNTFVAYSIASLPGMTWGAAMGLVVFEGIVIFLLVISGFRVAVFKAIPGPLKTATSVGIGLFIALIGLFDSHFVTAGPGIPFQLGIDGSLAGWPILVFVIGLFLTFVLMVRKTRGAILIGIVVGTVIALVFEAVFKIGRAADENPLGWSLNVPALEGSPVAAPTLAGLFQVDLFGAFTTIGALAACMLIFALVLTDFFDTMGTMVAIGAEAGILDKDGNPPHMQRILVVDSAAAAAGGFVGISSNTGFLESASGVGEGARTGLSAIVTGLCFALSMFFAPLVAMVPYEAATPALVIVGFLMMTQIKDINFGDWEIAIPAFLTIILIPFAYSISVGIGAGFIAYALIKLALGKARGVHPLMWVIAVAFLAYFVLHPLQDLLG